MKIYVCLIIISIAFSACGSNRSGVDENKKASELTKDEVQKICLWGIDLAGGEEKKVECAGGSVTLGTVDYCVQEALEAQPDLADGCELTVGQIEQCVVDTTADICAAMPGSCKIQPEGCPRLTDYFQAW